MYIRIAFNQRDLIINYKNLCKYECDKCLCEL